MAQRYVGDHSPGAEPAADRRGWTGKTRSRVGGRVNALFVAPIPLLPLAFLKDPMGLALNLVAFGILISAAWMTREGTRAHEAYDARKVAKRPALPRKLVGAVLTGLGLAVASVDGGNVLTPAIFAVLGGGLHILAFGADPMRDKQVVGVDEFQAGRVARVVDEAEQHLGAMKTAISRAGDRQAQARVDRFVATAREMCRTVEEDPRDLAAARKYLGVYLLGARDATSKYADLSAKSRDTKARADYLALLDDLEEGFAARNAKLLIADRTDLDVEIEVLRDRLSREGLVPASTAK